MHRDYLLGLIRRMPDLTLLEIQERLIANCGERFAVSVLWRFFDRHEITFKKTAHAEEQQREDVHSRRREWFAGQLDLDPTKLVFIDETGASTNLGWPSARMGAAGMGLSNDLRGTPEARLLRRPR